jgi:hypothetical protein
MSLSWCHGVAHRLTTLAAVAVLGMLTLVGLHAPIASAQEPDEPCLLGASLHHFTTSRTTLEAGSGQSATLSWQVVHLFPNTGCLSRLQLFLESNGTRSPVSKNSTRSVSPAFTTTYRLYLRDPAHPPPSHPSQPSLHDTYLGNPITITVLQPPPTPPSDCS